MDSAEKPSYSNYGICVQKQTLLEWKPIIDALLQKHASLKPFLLIYESDFAELLKDFRSSKPKYTCFVAQPKEITKEYYHSMHTFVRQIDEHSIYASTIFSILTGPDLETTLKIASYAKPLNVETVLSNTKLNFDPFKAGIAFSELTQKLVYMKTAGEEATKESLDGTDDIVLGLVEEINNNKVDLVVTSAHAREHDWRPAFRYPGGRFTHIKHTNKLIGVDLKTEVHRIRSKNPKVYLGCGNCLIANMDAPCCMSLSWMKCANVIQFAGYTVPSWFGFAGWGINKYFIETPGKFSFSEAYFANLQVLNYCKSLEDNKNNTKNDLKSEEAIKEIYEKHYNEEKSAVREGLEYDQNVVVLYGDPAWQAKISGEQAEKAQPYSISLEEVKPKIWKLKVVCLKECQWECPTADDHFTVPGRPPFYIFKERFRNKLKVIEGVLELTDLFAMMPLKGKSKVGEVHEAGFEEIC